jgi:4-hydroxybenzoate polyprenyltransferase
MKRITHWPQFVLGRSRLRTIAAILMLNNPLGLTFNWGALLGWSAVTNSLNWAVCGPLYASGILWTLVYDTAYAHQDKKDDAIVGIKSTALLFGENTRPILAAFLLGSAMCAGWAGLENGQGLSYFSALLMGTGLLGIKLRSVE